MYALLIFLISVCSTTAINAESVSKFQKLSLDNLSYGGWVGYIYTPAEYIIDEPYISAGLYAVYKIHTKAKVAGLVYYDPSYEAPRLGYAFGQYTDTIAGLDLSFKAGLLRSEWGFWSAYTANPSTSPLVMKSNALYTVRYESDINQHMGTDVTWVTHKNKIKINAFIGSYNTINESKLGVKTYIQDVPVNTEFGSLWKATIEYKPYIGNTFKLGYAQSLLSKEIDNNIERIYAGYKYEKYNVTLSFEYQRLYADGNINAINFHEVAEFDDKFIYIAYDFSKIRLYSSLSHTKKNQAFADYVNYALQAKGAPFVPFADDSANHYSSTIAVGVEYSIFYDLSLRLEGQYTKSKGIERILNNPTDVSFRNEEIFFMGASITKTF